MIFVKDSFEKDTAEREAAPTLVESAPDAPQVVTTQSADVTVVADSKSEQRARDSLSPAPSKASSPSSPAIPLPASIVSNHAASSPVKTDVVVKGSPLPITPTWKKPRPLVGVAITIIAIALTCAANMYSYWAQSLPVNLALVILQCFVISFFWSNCAYQLSGAFKYNSAQAARYGRMWIGTQGLFFSPVSLGLLLCCVQSVALLDAQYGQVPDLVKAGFKGFAWALTVVPALSTVSHYRFMYRVGQLRSAKFKKDSLQDKLPAFILAACHFIPLVAYEVWYISIQLQNKDVAQFLTVAGPILALLLQIVAFMAFSSLLKGIEPGASESESSLR